MFAFEFLDSSVGITAALQSSFHFARHVSPGTALAHAIETMEWYYAVAAETESQRWRAACSASCPPAKTEPSTDANTQNDATIGPDDVAIDPALFRGILPAIRAAVTKANARTSEREFALTEIAVKVADAEQILEKQKVRRRLVRFLALIRPHSNAIFLA